METPERKNVEKLFHQALRVPTGERRRYLLAACGENAVLLGDLESLLESHDDASAFLEKPVSSSGSLSVEVDSFGLGSDIDPEIGRRIGPYRIVRRLGNGGMGCVYLAERDDEAYQGRVAIKLVLRGMDSAEILRRFRAERQALASLSHPNVARLLDGGSLEDGRPYLVMELVDGERIDAYCERNGLAVPERLRLFRKVCDAVQYAHGHLVVHRDLKPSNILVTAEGEPKLLDFGIAKLLDAGARGLAEATAPSVRRMTLAYASPEQIRGSAVTTATDVYSLGVILYELLAGRPPHRVSDADRLAAEAAILEEAPEPPSRVTDRRFDRDLDNVVLMALRKEPARRYSSVEQLSSDLERVRSGLPVIARRDTLGYRTLKFVRRHRAAVVASALLVLALIGGTTATWIQALRAVRRGAEAERADRVAEEIARLLVSLFEVSDPRSGEGRDVKAIDLLDRGALRVEADREIEPLVRAGLLDSIGRSYANLGVWDRASVALGEALAIRVRELGVGHPDVAATLESTGNLRMLEGRPADAVPLLERALEIRRGAFGDDHALTMATRNGLAVACRNVGQFDRAESLLKGALRWEETRAAPRDELGWAMRDNLSVVALSAGRYAEAERLAREALGRLEGRVSSDHPDRATSLTNLGVALFRQGKFVEALSALDESMRIRVDALGEDHPDTASTRSHLGIVLESLGRESEAEKLLREAVTRLREVGEGHPLLDCARNNLAELLLSQGRMDEAESLYSESLRSMEDAGRTEGPDYAGTLNNVAFVREMRGDVRAAGTMYRRVLAIDRKLLGERHPDLAIGLSNLGRTLHARKRLRAAERLYREALEILREARGDEHPETAKQRLQLGLLLVDRGRLRDAEAEIMEGFRILCDVFGDSSAEVADARMALAYLSTRRSEERGTAR